MGDIKLLSLFVFSLLCWLSLVSCARLLVDNNTQIDYVSVFQPFCCSGTLHKCDNH